MGRVALKITIINVSESLKWPTSGIASDNAILRVAIKIATKIAINLKTHTKVAGHSNISSVAIGYM